MKKYHVFSPISRRYQEHVCSVRENVCNNSKNVKSHVLDFEKPQKTPQKTLKRTCSFTGYLITPAFNTQLKKVSTGKSPTSNTLLRNADTRNYAT